MEEKEGQAGLRLRELASLPDVLVVCSSAGWTDQKHMLYLGLLQESFVNQLHDGEISFRGLFKQSSKAAGRAKRWVKAEQTGPPCCGNLGDGEAHSVDDDDDASSIETVQESSDKASAASSGRSSPCRFGRRGRSPSRTAAAAEGSDQNFIDEDAITREAGESRGRRRSNKRMKSADHYFG